MRQNFGILWTHSILAKENQREQPCAHSRSPCPLVGRAAPRASGFLHSPPRFCWPPPRCTRARSTGRARARARPSSGATPSTGRTPPAAPTPCREAATGSTSRRRATRRKTTSRGLSSSSSSWVPDSRARTTAASPSSSARAARVSKGFLFLDIPVLIEGTNMPLYSSSVLVPRNNWKSFDGNPCGVVKTGGGKAGIGGGSDFAGFKYAEVREGKWCYGVNGNDGSKKLEAGQVFTFAAANTYMCVGTQCAFTNFWLRETGAAVGGNHYIGTQYDNSPARSSKPSTSAGPRPHPPSRSSSPARPPPPRATWRWRTAPCASPPAPPTPSSTS